MQRILVGVDGSSEAKAAAEFAADLARSTERDLVLAYFVQTPVTAESAAEAALQQAEQTYGEGVLREVAARCARPGVLLETVVRSGAPARGLAELASSPDVDMVVVGHRGRNKVQRLLLGSVADRLAHASPKPVIVHH